MKRLLLAAAAKPLILLVVLTTGAYAWEFPAAARLQWQAKALSRGPMTPCAIFDGSHAGSKADPAAKWDEATMAAPLDAFFMSCFRRKLAATLGKRDGDFAAGYAGLIAMIRELHAAYPAEQDVVSASQATLRGLFPDWPPGAPQGEVGLLHWFKVLFARPFPAFSARLNAWVTLAAAQWLMGPCVLEDLVLPEGAAGGVDLGAAAAAEARGEGGDEHGRRLGVLPQQKLVVRRCRYLEEAGCASVCVATCKLPTQRFFNDDMGVPMRMLPDYETFECAFEFGVAPGAEDEAEARAVSCFSACPSMRADQNRPSCT